MSLIGRFVAFAIVLLAASPVVWSAPAAAQETSGEFSEALTQLHAEMNSLTLELENFRVNGRYCKPPGIPSKAEAQAELDALAQRAQALTGRYAALKANLQRFAQVARVGAELMLNDRDPTDERWWRSYEAARRRLVDALARKRAALAAAPEVDCRPKPKPQPQPVVTTGGFQPPPLPVRPATDVSANPTLPPHFCSWDEYWKFINEVINPIYNKAAEDAERVARFRTEVEQAVNSYVQNNRPVPADLIARRRQAIADVEAANRRMRETEDLRNRAKAIPVIDCRQPQRQQEPPRTEPPRTEPTPTTPGPKFQTGSLLDDIRNRAWTLVEQMKAAYDRCDAAAYERALNELEKILEEAKLVRAAARGGGEFSTVKPEEADGLVDALRGIIEPRRWLLLELKRKCREPTRTQPPTTPSQTGLIPPPDRRLAVILEEHNKARAEVRSSALRWDPQLAAGAMVYAEQLARTGQRVHSSREGRGDVRENLNQGMLGWSPRQMMQNWLKERQNFVPGTYPNVTRTGRWQDVSHYTQMIWPTTTHVGCGLTSGSGFQWLVCRYSPGGNKDGRPILADNSGIAPPNSSTPTIPRLDPRDLPKDKMGGGMTQIDPPAPPPPPPPTARDDAPGGNEDNHPLVGYGAEAFIRHSAAVDCGNQAAADAELAKLRYALDELRKRLKAARKAGQFSAVKPDDVQRQINLLESFLRAAEQRRPRGVCPAPPPPPPPPP